MGKAANAPRIAENEAMAFGKMIRSSARKLNLVAELIRGKGAQAAVVVADQGRGIAPEDQARIFDKFERVDTSEPGGSGLGLYISRRLARAMGGEIGVDSAPGQGARFVLTLPAREVSGGGD